MISTTTTRPKTPETDQPTRQVTLPLSNIAELTGAIVTGDTSVQIFSLAKIEEAKEGDLTFLYLNTYEKYFAGTKASAIFVKKGFEKTRTDITYLEVDDPNKAFFQILIQFFSPKFPLQGIEASAFIHPSAQLAENVSLGQNVVISAGCKIGKNTRIFANTVIMDNVTIGEDVLIFPNVTVREECQIGNRVILYPGAVIGSDGFGYVPRPDRSYIKIPQIGNVVLEDDVEVGANTTIDRAALGSTVIEKGVKLDNLVQIAHNVVIGKNTVISSQTGVSGSTKIGENCILAGQVGMVGHITIADNVIVGAQSGVSKSLTTQGTYFGSPAKEIKHSLKLEAHIRNLPDYASQIKELQRKLEKLEKLIPKTESDSANQS